MGGYNKIIKRTLSIILSLILLVFLSPILLILYVIIKLKLGSPVFFTQYRPGMNEKIFKLIKFRTMSNDTDSNGVLLPDNQRLNKFGLFLRKSSLDELPELFNILKGDMAFIGPRPLSIHYLPSYDDSSRIRSNVRPGLTGLAQIRGRNSASWEERIFNDIFYVSNMSFILDIKIFFLTFFKVLKQDGIQVRTKDEEIKNYNIYKIVEEQSSMQNKKEIGSYFEWDEVNNQDYKYSIYDYLIELNSLDYAFTISGRSAIDLALQNILKDKKIKRAFLPSYSCISMTQPFLDNGINVEYYKVELDEFEGFKMSINVDILREDDLFLHMTYFGFDRERSCKISLLKQIKKKGVILIEDITHSIFSSNNYENYNDYEVCSLRKWFSIPSGGILYSRSASLKIKPDQVPKEKIDKKIEAMKNKKNYLLGNDVDKKNFLINNASFDNDLIRLNYENTIDKYSIDILKKSSWDDFSEKRKTNADFLIRHLVTSEWIYLPFKSVLEQDVPLFVPVIIKDTYRDKIRKIMIQEGIYLPVHWPEKISKKNDINSVELSLVCDQRYSQTDMQRIINIINNFNK